MAALRVAAHVHSAWSYDGRWTLPDLARAFKRRRYDAVLMAEHDRGFSQERWLEYRAACAEASRDGILLMPGIEYSDPSNTVHVPVWDAPEFFGEGLDTGDLLARVADEDALAVLAHPKRRGAWELVEPAWLDALLGVELWNRKYDGYAPSRAGAELLRRDRSLVAFAGLDFHTARQFHPLAMVIDAGAPTEEAVVEAMRERRLQATAFRLRASGLAHGSANATLRGAERARRTVVRSIRAAKVRR